MQQSSRKEANFATIRGADRQMLMCTSNLLILNMTIQGDNHCLPQTLNLSNRCRESCHTPLSAPVEVKERQHLQKSSASDHQYEYEKRADIHDDSSSWQLHSKAGEHAASWQDVENSSAP